MLVTGIKSKPVYAPLQPDIRGRYHLMLGMGVGAAPLLRVIDDMRAAAPPSLMNARVLFVSDAGGGAPEIQRFETAGIAEVLTFGGTPPLLERFRGILGQSLMGTR